MTKAALAVLLCGVGMAGSAWAQQEPTAYTVTVVNSMMGPAVEQTFYRDGNKAVIDTNSPAPAGGAATHVRALYDLGAHTDESWDLNNSSAGCGTGNFSGDWGDPFTPLVDLSKATLTGTETMNGFATKVYTADADGATAKLWIEPKTGLAIRIDVTQAGKTSTLTQVTKFTVGAPAASLFALPAVCTKPAGPPPPSQHDLDIAAETNSKVGDFVDAVMTADAGSATSCSVNIRVMAANSMKPIVSGFKLSAKVLDDQGNDGAMLTVTAGTNGVWRLDNASPRFDMSEDFGDAGGGGGTVRRWCVSPVSTLLLVVKDPQALGKGADWVWDVKGKYAVK